MALLPLLIQYFTFPLHQQLTQRSTLRVSERLRESQRWPAEKLQQWQEEKIQQLLAHATHHVPYYRDLFRQLGLSSESAAGKDWARIPVLTKDIVRKNFDKLQATDRPRLFITGQTSGSTGSPVTWRIDRDAESVQQAAHLRAREGWGLRLGDPHVMLWGRDTFQGSRKQLRDLWIWNKRALAAMEISEDKVEAYYQKLRAYRPRYLRGYPTLLVQFARLCQSHGFSLKELSLKVMIATAEVLSPAQRLEIQKAYGAPVANEYGCSEVQLIAFECPQGSMHIQADAVRVELLQDGKPVPPGEPGEVVVTDLSNRIMPVIRYQTGDRGRFKSGACPCGRTLPLMELTIGRMGDLIELPDGRVIHSEVFTPTHDSLFFKLVQQFHVLQETPTRFRVQVVVKNEEDFRQVREEYLPFIAAQVGSGIEMKMERVAKIQSHSSGKQPYFTPGGFQK